MKDRAFAFQVRLELHGEVPFLARPDIRGLFSNDWDDEVADLQYRNFKLAHHLGRDLFFVHAAASGQIFMQAAALIHRGSGDDAATIG